MSTLLNGECFASKVKVTDKKTVCNLLPTRKEIAFAWIILNYDDASNGNSGRYKFKGLKEFFIFEQRVKQNPIWYFNKVNDLLKDHSGLLFKKNVRWNLQTIRDYL